MINFFSYNICYFSWFNWLSWDEFVEACRLVKEHFLIVRAIFMTSLSPHIAIGSGVVYVVVLDRFLEKIAFYIYLEEVDLDYETKREMLESMEENREDEESEGNDVVYEAQKWRFYPSYWPEWRRVMVGVVFYGTAHLLMVIYYLIIISMYTVYDIEFTSELFHEFSYSEMQVFKQRKDYHIYYNYFWKQHFFAWWYSFKNYVSDLFFHLRSYVEPYLPSFSKFKNK